MQWLQKEKILYQMSLIEKPGYSFYEGKFKDCFAGYQDKEQE